MRTALSVCAVAAFACTLGPARADQPPTGAATLTFGPAAVGQTVTYRFTMKMERPPMPDGQGAPGGAGSQSPANAGGSSMQTTANGGPPADGPPPMSVSFTEVDATHVRLTTVGAASEETLLADRSSDGRLHAKLHRGSQWAQPIQLYNRLASATSAAESMPVGSTKSGDLPMLSADETIPGSLSVAPEGSGIRVAIDGQGPIDPGGMGGPPSGGMGGPGGGMGGPGGGMGGGGMGGGMGGPPGGGMGGGQRGGGHDGGMQATASMHVVLHYTSGVFAKGESTESLTFDGPEAHTMSRHWTVERVS